MLGLLATVALAAPTLSPVRTSSGDPGLPEEDAAIGRLAGARCHGSDLALVPGLWQWCTGHPVEGIALGGLAFAELGVGVGLILAVPPDPEALYLGTAGPTFLLAATEPWVYGSAEAVLETERARRMPYVPLDATRDLFLAPFRPRVALRPDVLFGTLALVGGGIAIDAALQGSAPSLSFAPPNLLGAHPPPGVGYPALALLDGGLAIQVATTEESVFRGLVQSGFVRSTSETGGWLLGSATFGLLHASNALFLPPEDQLEYLAFAVPYITVVGTWIGLVYRWSGYRLAPPVAIHFWYDAISLVEATLVSPEQHPFSLTLGGRF